MDLLRLKMTLLCLRDDRPCKRVLTLHLKRISQAQQIILCPSCCRKHIGYLRLPRRDRACLVQRDNLNSSGILKCLARLEQDSILGSHPVSDHDGDRCRQPQRTRTGDDKHGDGVFQRSSERMSCQKPAGQNHSRDQNDSRHEDAGDFVCDLGNRCLGCSRVRDHLHDLRKGCVLADPGCPCADESALVDGRRADSIPGCLIDRNRFTCQSRFIDSSRSFYDHPVDRDGFARFHDKDISALNLVNSDRHHLAVPLDTGCLRCHFHQILQCIGRSAFRQ